VVFLARDGGDGPARLLVALGVAAFRHPTTALTMRRGAAVRDRLGDDFRRMVHLAARWAGLRSPLEWAGNRGRDVRPWVEAHSELIDRFVDGSLSADRPPLTDLEREANDAIDGLFTRRTHGRTKRRANPVPADGGPERTRRRRRGLHGRVLAASFGWVDLTATAPRADRDHSLAALRELIAVVLSTFPPATGSAYEEIEGTPGDLDNWTFRLLARCLPAMRPADRPELLWRPILDLGPRAHYWVEHFLAAWFTHGFEAAEGPEDFGRVWSEMVRYALDHPLWPAAPQRGLFLDGMVCELLGCNWGARTVAADGRYVSVLGQMGVVFERAARRWFARPRVASGFADLIVLPAAPRILSQGIVWLHEAAGQYNDHDWEERGLRDNFLTALRVCWERDHQAVAHTPALNRAFLGLLTKLSSFGDHTATALHERIVTTVEREGNS
jgi:hypothetical protein